MTNYISMSKNKNTIISQEIHAYQQQIDFINFATITIWFNVIAATSKLTEYFTNFSKHHKKQADRTLKYLAHTKNYVIIYNEQATNSNIIFLNFFNVFFVNNVNTRQSFNNYYFKLFNDLIDWKTLKQKTIITNFTKTKFLVMFMTINTKMW